MMTKDGIRRLREDLNAALTEVGLKYGLKISAGNATFDLSSATFKLVCSTVTESGRVITPQASAYSRVSAFYGWLPLFSTVTINGADHTIIGYNARKRHNPVLVERNGMTYAVSESFVSRKAESVG